MNSFAHLAQLSQLYIHVSCDINMENIDFINLNFNYCQEHHPWRRDLNSMSSISSCRS